MIFVAVVVVITYFERVGLTRSRKNGTKSPCTLRSAFKGQISNAGGGSPWQGTKVRIRKKRLLEV